MMEDPTSRERRARHGEAPPWPPPRPLEPPPQSRRVFSADDVEWVAWVAGGGVGGTGGYNLALVEAIHFALLAAPDVPQREALAAHGTFAALYDAELVSLLARAERVGAEAAEEPRRRGGGTSANRPGGARRPRSGR